MIYPAPVLPLQADDVTVEQCGCGEEGGLWNLGEDWSSSQRCGWDKAAVVSALSPEGSPGLSVIIQPGYTHLNTSSSIMGWLMSSSFKKRNDLGSSCQPHRL